MKKFIENKIRRIFRKPVSLRKQLTRMITLCCIAAVCIQAIFMVTLLVNQYVVQERENILYILESDNLKIDNTFQYIEEMALAMQNNVGLREFFQEADDKEELIKEQLKSAANLYSERNRLESQEPFVEKVYLFNTSGNSVCNLYYPMTISEMKESQKTYQALYDSYKESEKAFYFQIDGKYLNLCMKLYDSQMKNLGTCIFALNKNGIEEIFTNLQRMKHYSWNICQGEEILLGEKTISSEEQLLLIEHKMETGFGLKMYVAVPEWVVYQSVGIVVGVVLLILTILTAILSILGRRLAIYYVRPLENIAEKIKLVGKGNFDTKLEEYHVEELQKISSTFNDMTNDIQRLVKEVYENQLLAQQAQIQYLQAQMNPHFLFNVLSMIQMKAAMNGDKEVQEMLQKLSGLYQGKIFRKNEYFIYLDEEMEIVDFYLALQSSRFGEKVGYSIFYEGGKETYQNLMVPRLSIEPIVENAVRHGLEPKEGKGRIQINISKDETALRIYIADDGVGFDPETITEKSRDKSHNYVGLWNTDKLIHNLCGEEYGLKVESEIGEGTRVSVFLPVRNGEKYVESNDC